MHPSLITNKTSDNFNTKGLRRQERRKKELPLGKGENSAILQLHKQNLREINDSGCRYTIPLQQFLQKQISKD